MYIKEFEPRWSDIDANRHLANSAYISFMTHTRMAFLSELGFTLKNMVVHAIGPVVFYEHMYYFKEVLPGTQVRVSLEVMGMSEDGMFFSFHHNFYDDSGRHLALCEMMGSWIDLKTRKLTVLPPDFLEAFKAAERAAEFKVLTKEDTRKFAKAPKDLKPHP